MGTPAQRLSERVVLVVDDEPVVCRIATRALTDAGFRVLEAHSGEEAEMRLGATGAASCGNPHG
jgi:CheY-like chemotaxis protein